MTISPKYAGILISATIGVITSVLMSFVGLAFNYGFHPDFMARWLKAAAISYVTVVPVLILIVPRIQRFILTRAGISQPPAVQPRSQHPA